MASRPKYVIARALLDLTTGIAIIAVIIGGFVGVAGYSLGHSFYHYGAAAFLILNGILAIAGSQMGAAVLDTAVSTRELADNVLRTLERDAVPKARPEPSLGIRATR